MQGALESLFKNVFALPPALDSPTSSQSACWRNQGYSLASLKLWRSGSAERFEKEILRLGTVL